MTDSNLLFRRQFLLTPDTCASLSHWQHQRVGQFHLYAHPDVQLTTATSTAANATVALVGYIIDPNHPERSNGDVLNDIATIAGSVDGVSDYLDSVSGRFVLVIATPGDTLLFHDPCGLRTACYTRYKGNVVVGSQPLLLREVVPLREGMRHASYVNSAYVGTHTEHWIPSGCSLYENVYHLVPNHYLRFSTHEQTRYWPNRCLPQRDVGEVAAEAADLLQRLLVAANNRFKLALPLTAGWDSRLLLSASKSISDQIYFYTLQYRDLDSRSNDIKIPNQILRSLGLHHNLIDCRKTVSEEFRGVYVRSASLAHMDDWGTIANGMTAAYPQDRVCVKGNCSEIARCFYYKSGKHEPITSADQLIALENGWRDIGFICDQVSTWYGEARGAAAGANIDILDLFYWEHRMGSWQAQSQLEWDIVQEAYTPYNHRRLLELLLSTPAALRSAPSYSLYKMMCMAMWPEVMRHPVNPRARADRIKRAMKRMLRRLSLYEAARRAYRWAHRTDV
jgi:hypothetical protein